MGQTKRFTLSGDLYSNIDFDLDPTNAEPVIFTDLFIGESDTPSITQQISLRELLDDYIEANIIPGGTLKPEYRETILSFLNSVITLTEEKIKEVRNIPDWNEPKKIKEKKSKKKK